MDWSIIGAVGELLGALAVVASLFYVAGQIKHRHRVSDFCSGQRDLSHTHVRALGMHLGIPADILLGFDDDSSPVKRNHGG